MIAEAPPPPSIVVNDPQRTERGNWHVRTTVRRFHADIDEYRERYGQELGEALFFSEHKPESEQVVDGNLLMTAGADLLIKGLIGTAITAYSNANAYIGVGDGTFTTTSGTYTFTNGSTAVTGSGTSATTDFSVGDYIVNLADTTNTLYQITVISSNTALTIAAAYTGSTSTNAAGKESPSETGLKASSNKTYVGMDATYPTHTGGTNTTTWSATFGSSAANYVWNEFAVFNASAGGGTMLNRKVPSPNLGTKTGGSWQLQVTLTIK